MVLTIIYALFLLIKYLVGQFEGIPVGTILTLIGLDIIIWRTKHSNKGA